MLKCQCQPLFICLGVFLAVVGVTCLFLSVVQVTLMIRGSEIGSVKGNYHQVDVCDAEPEEGEVSVHWYTALCIGSTPARDTFGLYQYDQLCNCIRARKAACVMMLIVSGIQFLVGLAYSWFGCFGFPVSSCTRGRAWLVLCCILVFLCVLCLVSFILALLYRMAPVGEHSDRSTSRPVGIRPVENNGNRIFVGTAFTALCGIDMFLNLIGTIICCVGICRRDKDNNNSDNSDNSNTTTAQGQSQRSQTLSALQPISRVKATIAPSDAQAAKKQINGLK